MTTHNAPQGPQSQNPYESAPWATGRHANTPPPVPPHGMGAWTPPPAEPPRKKGGKWKWALGVLAVLVVIGMVNGGGEPATEPASATAPVAAPVPAPVAPAPAPAEPAVETAEPQAAAPVETEAPAYEGYGATTAKYGETVQAGDMSVTVEKPKRRSQQYLGTQMCSEVSYRNTGSTTEPFNMFDWKFRTGNGVETSVSAPFNAAGKSLTSGELSPGGNVSGEVCGELDTLDVTSVVYNPGFGIMHQVAFE